MSRAGILAAVRPRLCCQAVALRSLRLLPVMGNKAETSPPSDGGRKQKGMYHASTPVVTCRVVFSPW